MTGVVVSVCSADDDRRSRTPARFRLPLAACLGAGTGRQSEQLHSVVVRSRAYLALGWPRCRSKVVNVGCDTRKLTRTRDPHDVLAPTTQDRRLPISVGIPALRCTRRVSLQRWIERGCETRTQSTSESAPGKERTSGYVRSEECDVRAQSRSIPILQAAMAEEGTVSVPWWWRVVRSWHLRMWLATGRWS